MLSGDFAPDNYWPRESLISCKPLGTKSLAVVVAPGLLVISGDSVPDIALAMVSVRLR